MAVNVISIEVCCEGLCYCFGSQLIVVKSVVGCNGQVSQLEVSQWFVSFGGKLVEVIKVWKFVVWVMKRINIFFLISLSLSFRPYSCQEVVTLEVTCSISLFSFSSNCSLFSITKFRLPSLFSSITKFLTKVKLQLKSGKKKF